MSFDFVDALLCLTYAGLVFILSYAFEMNEAFFWFIFIIGEIWLVLMWMNSNYRYDKDVPKSAVKYSYSPGKGKKYDRVLAYIEPLDEFKSFEIVEELKLSKTGQSYKVIAQAAKDAGFKKHKNGRKIRYNKED